MAGKVCATGLGVRGGLHWVPMTLPLTPLYVITHILALHLSEALYLAGYPGNLPRPQTWVNPTWMMHFLPIPFFLLPPRMLASFTNNPILLQGANCFAVPTWEGTALGLPTHAHRIRAECARSSEVLKPALHCALCKGGRSLDIQTPGCDVFSGAVGPHSSSTCMHEQHIDPFLQHAVMKNLLCAHLCSTTKIPSLIFFQKLMS